MALNKTALTNALKTLNADMASGSGLTPNQYADRMATLIDDYVRAAVVKITAGQSVTVTTPPVQTNTVLANGGGPVLGSIATPAAGFEWVGTLS
jgi:hypothetical protein